MYRVGWNPGKMPGWMGGGERFRARRIAERDAKHLLRTATAEVRQGDGPGSAAQANRAVTDYSHATRRPPGRGL